MRRIGSVVALVLAGCGAPVVWYGKSPDRRHEAVVLQDGARQRVRVDGRDGRAYSGIGVETVAWSADSRHIAFAARRAEGWTVVADGHEGPPWEGVGAIVWSANGDHLAYVAERGNTWLVVRDGRPGRPHDGVRAGSLRISADGSRLAYVAERAGGVVAVVDGEELGPYDAISHLVLSGARVGFLARRGKSGFVVVDGSTHGPYEDVADLAFGPKTGRVAWTAFVDGAWRAIVDGCAGEPFDKVGALVWSRTERLAFLGGRGTSEVVVVDRQPGSDVDEVMPESLTFDESGSRVLYAARRGATWRVVINGTEGPAFNSVERPQFRGSSGEAAYIARRGGLSQVVAGGLAGAWYFSATGLVVSPDGSRFALLVGASDGGVTRLVEGAFESSRAVGARLPVEKRSTSVGPVVAGTLTFTPDGLHIGCLAGDLRTRKLRLFVDGEPSVPLDTEELAARLTAGAGSDLFGEGAALASWVRAEMTICTESARCARRHDGRRRR